VEQDSVLVVTRLVKGYRAGAGACAARVEVLRGVTLRVAPGEFVTVDGPAGSGKSTLVHCAAGLLRPDEGSVAWPALVTRAYRPPASIGLAADRGPPYAFLTVRESVAYAVAVRELDDPRAAVDSSALLDLVSLRGVDDVRVGLLGAAERSRLLVALALVSSPRLLLIDGLDGGADAVARAEFARCLVRIVESGVAVLWAARAIGTVAGVTVAYHLAAGRLTEAQPEASPPSPRASLELDVPVAGKAAALLAPRVPIVECRGPRVRVPLERTTAEEVLALCRTLDIPVHASRVVREP
jgi:putative ABC transport system ATP-binding protein